MVFSSYAFVLAFLPTALGGFWLASRFGMTAAKVWLCAASLVFYGIWHAEWLPILAVSILANYQCARWIRTARSERIAKGLLWGGVSLNLLALFYYKYLFAALGALGLELHPIALPLGISFFTFTQIAFLVDVAQGFAHEYRLINYTLFVTFFPHLVAGPIIHHKDLMPQFEEPRNYRVQPVEVAIGLAIFCIGLVKKTVIADNMSAISSDTLNHATIDVMGAWLGVLTYSMQLYFDFSGYSDMAIGLARMFGIRFPINFASPYKATNIIDFWQRWHITLTRFLTAYVYNPIALAIARRRAARGRSNSSKASRTPAGFAEIIVLPTMVTIVLAGIWHGAGLQFVIFGALHGVYISVNHAWRNFRPRSPAPPRRALLSAVGCTILVYLCVLLAQIFFRAESAREAVTLLAQMGGADGFGLPRRLIEGLHLQEWVAAHGVRIVTEPYVAGFLYLLAAMLIAWLAPNTQEIMGRYDPALGVARVERDLPFQIRLNRGWAFAFGVLLFLGLFYVRADQPFIYYQF